MLIVLNVDLNPLRVSGRVNPPAAPAELPLCVFRSAGGTSRTPEGDGTLLVKYGIKDI